MINQLTLGKKERLSHRNHIDAVFNEGRSFNISPFKVFYRMNDADPELVVKILFAVAKKKFKRAVDRNHIRRLIREAYRLNKHVLLGMLKASPVSLHIGFVYVGDKADISYKEIEQQMIGCLEKMGKIVNGS